MKKNYWSFIIKFCIALVLVFISKPYIHKVCLRVLNTQIPISYRHLVGLSENFEKCDPIELRRYIHYYKFLAVSMPSRHEAYGMLGFCYYYLGKERQAVAFYQKAKALNKDYFWYYYNLGFISYKNGDYKQAEKFLKIALEKNAQAVIKTVFSSKVYVDILRDVKDPENVIKGHYKGACQAAYQMLLSIYTQEKNFQEMYRVKFMLQGIAQGENEPLFGVQFF